MIREVCKRAAAQFYKRCIEIALEEGHQENSESFHQVIERCLDKTGGVFISLGQYKPRVKEDNLWIRVVIKNAFYILCQPAHEEIHLDWAFPQGHGFWPMFRNCVNLQTGWGWELELEDYIELMTAIAEGYNPVFVSRCLGEEIQKYSKKQALPLTANKAKASE